MGHHHHHHHTHDQQQHHGHSYGVPPPTAPLAYSPHQHSNVSLDQGTADHHRHSRNEHMAEAGALAAGTFAIYEAHKAKQDPMHAQRHKMEAGAAGVVALGSAAYALHEHHEKKKEEHLLSGYNGHHQESHHSPSHQHHHHRKHHHH